MSYDLIEKENQYLSELKIMSHTGSGPVDPAPKEKETKSPVEDGTGEGTKQAATGHPNKIPPIAYLKKELAKERIELTATTKEELMAEISSLSEEEKAVIKQKLSEQGFLSGFKAGRKIGKQMGASAKSAKKAAIEKGISKKGAKKHAKAAAIRSLRKEPMEASRSDLRDVIASKRKVKKEDVTLADELEYVIEMCGKDHKKEKVKEESEKCAECGKGKGECECPGAMDADKEMKDEKENEEAEKEIKEQDEAEEVEADSDAEEKNEVDDEKEEVKEQAKPDFLDVDKDKDKKEPMKKALKDKDEEAEEMEAGEADDTDSEAEEEVGEQMSVKNRARISGTMDNPPPVADSPAEKAARMSANVPPAAIQKMRRPIPERPALTSGRVKGQEFQTRPVRMARI